MYILTNCVTVSFEVFNTDSNSLILFIVANGNNCVMKLSLLSNGFNTRLLITFSNLISCYFMSFIEKLDAACIRNSCCRLSATSTVFYIYESNTSYIKYK